MKILSLILSSRTPKEYSACAGIFFIVWLLYTLYNGINSPIVSETQTKIRSLSAMVVEGTAMNRESINELQEINILVVFEEQKTKHTVLKA